MFRVDPYAPTVRTLDLSMRFFKMGSKVKNVTPRKSGGMNDLPEELKGQYFEIYRGFLNYDDEQKLLLISMHYNGFLKEHLAKSHPEMSNLSF